MTDIPGTYQTGKIGVSLRPLIVIESPFKADRMSEEFFRNRVLIRRLCNHALIMGFNPYASHIFFPEFLAEDDTSRRLGIECGLMWSRFAEQIWFVTRRGETLTEGMSLVLDFYIRESRPLRFFHTLDNGFSLVEYSEHVNGQTSGHTSGEQPTEGTTP